MNKVLKTLNKLSAFVATKSITFNRFYFYDQKQLYSISQYEDTFWDDRTNKQIDINQFVNDLTNRK